MRANGSLLWEGTSTYDNETPVVALLTGHYKTSRNPKTGDMLQVYYLRGDIPPHVAVAEGKDGAVCGQCPLRPVLARSLENKTGKIHGRCYVTTSNSVAAVWRAWKRGKYFSCVASEEWASHLKYHREKNSGKRKNARLTIRFGAYGNGSCVPFHKQFALARSVHGWTMYLHDWQTCDQDYKRMAMASVSSTEEKERASALGWRTFRVRQKDEPVLSDEIVCPASDEGGKKTTCSKCLLCSGTEGKGRKNVVIIDHGPNSELAQLNRDRAIEKKGKMNKPLTGTTPEPKLIQLGVKLPG